MLVRATRTGYFGNKRIKEGQVFKLSDLRITLKDPKTGKDVKKEISAASQFSELWMEKVEAKEAKVVAPQAVKFDKEDNVEEVI